MELWLVRHGQTEWSAAHKHTSTTDLPLLEQGERDASGLRERLAALSFDLVLTSPRQRARRTAELAGFPAAEVDDDLVVWDYGDYEGRSTEDIREDVAGWTVWTHPTPGGESADEVAARCDRVVERVRVAGERVLVFGHGHALRALTARWLGEPAFFGRHLKLDTATLSTLGFERETPVILSWNG